MIAIQEFNKISIQLATARMAADKEAAGFSRVHGRNNHEAPISYICKVVCSLSRIRPMPHIFYCTTYFTSIIINIQEESVVFNMLMSLLILLPALSW